MVVVTSIASAARWKQKRWKAGAYDYYVFDNVTSPVSAMMACPDGRAKIRHRTAG